MVASVPAPRESVTAPFAADIEAPETITVTRPVSPALSTATFPTITPPQALVQVIVLPAAGDAAALERK